MNDNCPLAGVSVFYPEAVDFRRGGVYDFEIALFPIRPDVGCCRERLERRIRGSLGNVRVEHAKTSMLDIPVIRIAYGPLFRPTALHGTAERLKKMLRSHFGGDLIVNVHPALSSIC